MWHHRQTDEAIDKWISEYKTWYEITYGQINHLNDESNDLLVQNMYQQNEHANGNVDNIQINTKFVMPPQPPPTQNYYSQDEFTYPIISLQNINQDITYFPCRQNGKTQHQRQSNMNIGYWGPLLRYGTYGVYQRYSRPVSLHRNCQLANDNTKLSLIHPLDLPLRIKIPRQAMIGTLQSKLKSRLYDLRKIEKDPIRHMGISYSTNLELLTKQCGTCPRYLYTKVDNLPNTEREYFTFLDRNSPCRSFLSIDGNEVQMKATNDFYVCELLIGDIIISQGFALWKRRSREVCAKKALENLDQPNYLVGSTRYWYGTDYMTACTTNDHSVAPILPPFITDPTEPLYKKDEKINECDPEENFDILNPKSIQDFWLYATTLKPGGNIKNIDPQTLLYQSAEFSQMNLSFEIDSCWDQSFACTVMIDKSPAIRVGGLGNLEQACQAAALVLVDKLVDTQPIVVLQEEYHQQYLDLENYGSGCRDNEFLVRSLMWAQQDFDSPINFGDLSQLVTLETFPSTATKLQDLSSEDRISHERDLEYFLDIYAQSSLVNPLQMDASCLVPELWSSVADKCRKVGLMVMRERQTATDEADRASSVLICKQMPHSKLKAVLMRDKSFGVFALLSDGTLSAAYLDTLNQFIYYDHHRVDDDDDDDGDNGNDNDIGPPIFQSWHRCPYGDDIPRDSIPGLDF